ncbi:MAG: O-antigen ligase family protein [Pseudomonadota bacterium]
MSASLEAGRRFLAAVPFWYIVAVPSLLFLTNIGEQAYQDAFFVVLFVYALVRGRADWSIPVLTIWGGWLAYLAWWVLTDSLGAGALFLDPLRTGLLMLLLPWLVGWARDDNFRRPLGIGFRVALIVAAAVAVVQVLAFGAPRATGSENALVFATLVSIYGLFTVYEECVRERGRPILWMLFTLIPVTLSGSRTVIVVLLFVFLLLLIRHRRAVDFRVLIAGLVGSALFLAVFAAPQIASRVTNVLDSVPTSEAGWHGFRDEFVGMDFVEPASEQGERAGEISLELKDSYRSSLGFRLVFWRTGWEVFLAHPLLGVGSTQDTLEVGRTLGLGTFFDDRFSHVHNTFLQQLVSGGLTKLVFLLAVLVLPLICLRPGPAGREPMLFITAALALFGMTNIVLELTVVTFIYTLVIAYFLAARSLPGRTGINPAHQHSDSARGGS